MQASVQDCAIGGRACSPGDALRTCTTRIIRDSNESFKTFLRLCIEWANGPSYKHVACLKIIIEVIVKMLK